MATYCKLENSIPSLRDFTAVCQKIVIRTPHIYSGSKPNDAPDVEERMAAYTVVTGGPEKNPVKYNSYHQG